MFNVLICRTATTEISTHVVTKELLGGPVPNQKHWGRRVVPPTPGPPGSASPVDYFMKVLLGKGENIDGSTRPISNSADSSSQNRLIHKILSHETHRNMPVLVRQPQNKSQ